MSKILNLVGEERLETGKGHARSLKGNNKVPAIIYGGSKPHVMIALNEKEITQEYNKSGFMSHLFDIQIGNNKYRAIPKDIQLDPVSDKIIHADFMHVGEHDKIKVFIPIEFINKDKCIGLKHGGVVNALKHEIEVVCKADSIPSSIQIDLADLEIGHSVHIRDISFPKGVESVYDETVTVATIIGSTKEVAEETAVVEGATEEQAASGAPAPAAEGKDNNEAKK